MPTSANQSDRTIHALFEEQAVRTPEAVAVKFALQHVTYAELNRRANAVAEELRQKGVGVETPVGIHLERSINLVAGVLGVLKAGGFYIPLDPAFPQDRLAYMVADAGIPVILTHSRLTSELPEHRAQLVCIDQCAQAPSEPDERPDLNHIEPANLAYVLFTSGSTGRPKGVQITHRAVVNFLRSMQASPGMQASDILLAVTTLSFDIAGLELFLPLATGAQVVIASREETLDGARLARLMQTSGVTVMQATPVTWRMLIEAGWAGDPRLKVLCGGEAIDRSLADQLLSRCGELWNMYGPTETTIWSTTDRLMPGQPITIGRPIANTQVYIMDDAGQPVPPGMIGELFIGGHGVARGYLNQPELTAQRFIHDPFSPNEADRLYRTGDLARYLADGRIEFVGRADQQVKIRGFRIEIGEVETALAALEGVASAVVAVRETDSGEKHLVACVVAKAHASSPPFAESGGSPSVLDAAALRNALRATLPDYMIPADFVFVHELPLTPNGKVDRKALARLVATGHARTSFEAPRGRTESKLARIMAQLLRLPGVGRSDDFFALGGHSILAAAMFSEIEREFGRRLPLAALFRAPTVAALASLLKEENAPAQKWSSLIPIQPHGKKPRFFCVHGAGGNVLLYRDLVRLLGPDHPFYGLQSQGLDERTKPLVSIEEMAGEYIKEIRTLQPDGPYCLGGYCLGGTIAYEMAQQLRRDGHEVALLALFDTYNFNRMDKAAPFGYLRQKIGFHLRNLAGLPWRNLPGYLLSKVRVAADGELRSLWNSFSKSLKMNPGEGKPHLPADTLQEINDEAAATYQPKAYGGPVTVFKPKTNYDIFPDPNMGWGECATGGLDVVELPVNPHAMLVAPFVQHLARELGQRIDHIADTAKSSFRH